MIITFIIIQRKGR